MLPMRAALDLLLPPACPGCGQEGFLICSRCWAPFCRRLDEPAGAPLGMPVELPVGLLQLEWCATFSGPVRAALHALKYDGERRLARPIGRLLASRWRRAGVGGDLLVPVPVHAMRLRERGYDQARLLALEAAAELGLPMIDGLERRVATSAQYGLGRAARRRNLQDAFAAREAALPALTGRWVVLIDDVVTTGATLSTCAVALRRAGAAAVSALAAARER